VRHHKGRNEGGRGAQLVGHARKVTYLPFLLPSLPPSFPTCRLLRPPIPPHVQGHSMKTVCAQKMKLITPRVPELRKACIELRREGGKEGGRARGVVSHKSQICLRSLPRLSLTCLIPWTYHARTRPTAPVRTVSPSRHNESASHWPANTCAPRIFCPIAQPPQHQKEQWELVVFDP